MRTRKFDSSPKGYTIGLSRAEGGKRILRGQSIELGRNSGRTGDDEGDVVGGGGASGEGVDFGDEFIGDGSGGEVAEGGGFLGEALFAEFLVAVERAGFGDAIAKEDENVAGFKSDGGFLVGSGGHDSEDDSAAAEALGAAVGFDENGRIVAGVAIG